MSISDWNQWDDCHSSEDQIKRQQRACERKLTPSTIDTDNQTATFWGSHSNHYETSLTGCTCIDFRRRGVPCKHMYRLAYELHITDLNADVQEASVPIMSKESALDLVFSSLTTEEELSLFKDFCYRCGNNNAGEQLISADFAEKLISSGLAVEVTDVTKRLSYMKMSNLRKLVPEGEKCPRKKDDLIQLLTSSVNSDDISYPDDSKCLTLHPSISHLGNTIHRKLCGILPDKKEPTFFW